MPGILYIVSTPIGNLDDITLRAVKILEGSDLITCEDTRRTGKLLKHLGIDGRLTSLHEHNEEARADEIVEQLIHGKTVSLVSDAGTPLISDPGYILVKAAIEAGIAVVPIPGASAAIAALSASGLPSDSFFFGGFLPAKQSQRRKRLEQLGHLEATLILYEAPHRILRALADIESVLGDRRVVIARELTKLHEEYLRGTAAEIASRIGKGSSKGEFVILIDRAGKHDRNGTVPEKKDLEKRISELGAGGLGSKEALKAATKEYGLTRAEAYRILHSLKT